MAENKPEHSIYFHVGMGKVASKYLQYEIFPKLKGIHYIPTTKYFEAKEIIQHGNASSYLVSREFDQQMEREVKKFAEKFPDTKAILFLRRHDSWIASQYRRFAKNGYVRSFDEFLDIENDKGRFKLQDLNFYRNIEILNTNFTEKPLILFYDDFLSSPLTSIDKIAAFTKTVYNKDEIKLAKKHTSYEEKQIRAMQKVSSIISFKEKRFAKNSVLHFLQKLPVLCLRYAILYSALLIPASWFSKEELIPQETLKKIHRLTEADWKKCIDYAREHNPV